MLRLVLQVTGTDLASFECVTFCGFGRMSSRGELAVALNCTIRKVSEKTMAVSASMPEAIAE